MRLQACAEHHLKRTGGLISPGDLLHCAIVRLLEGGWTIEDDRPIDRQLERIMWSISGNSRPRAGPRWTPPPPDPDEECSRHDVESLLSYLDDDALAIEFLLSMDKGMTAAETRERMDITETQYQTIRRRILRGAGRLGILRRRKSA